MAYQFGYFIGTLLINAMLAAGIIGMAELTPLKKLPAIAHIAATTVVWLVAAQLQAPALVAAGLVTLGCLWHYRRAPKAPQ